MDNNKATPADSQEQVSEGTTHVITQDDLDRNPGLQGQVEVGEEVVLGPEVDENGNPLASEGE